MNVKWENLAAPWATVKTETSEFWIDYSALDRILNDPSATDDSKAMVRIVQSAILAEREACAKICDEFASHASTEMECSNYARRQSFNDASLAIRARSNPAPETEKEIIVRMPPKSRQTGIFTANPAQTMDSQEIIAPDPVSA